MIQNRRHTQSYNQISLWNKVCQVLPCCRQPCLCSVVAIMYTCVWLAYGHVHPKIYRIGLLFSYKNGDFGAISVTEWTYAVPMSKVESHISDRCSHCHTKSIRSFVISFVHSFGRLLAGSFTHSLTHSFIHSFIHLFIFATNHIQCL